MNTALDCIPCFLRQSLRVARLATQDVAVHEAVLRETLKHANQWDLSQPPLLAQWIYRQVRERTGVCDPYLPIKRESNRLALELYPAWKQRVLASEFPLRAAAKLAIAANIIDFGVNGDLATEDIPSILEESYHSPICGDVNRLFDATARASNILYLADNAGELVYDRLFIELLGRSNITVVVKGGPAINDALWEDAKAAGLTDIVEVIDNGVDGAGTLLDTCSAEFQKRFAQAGVIIAKGQANYESLAENPREIYFLLKVKCPLVGRHIGHAVGSLVVHRTGPALENISS